MTLTRFVSISLITLSDNAVTIDKLASYEYNTNSYHLD